MDVAMGVGKTYNKRAATFHITGNKLVSDFPKIGKMPGKIKIELPFKILKDSILSAIPESNAGTMKMPMGLKFKLKLDSLKGAKISNQNLSFKMTVYGQFMGTKHPATITFSGKKLNQ